MIDRKTEAVTSEKTHVTSLRISILYLLLSWRHDFPLVRFKSRREIRMRRHGYPLRWPEGVTSPHPPSLRISGSSKCLSSCRGLSHTPLTHFSSSRPLAHTPSLTLTYTSSHILTYISSHTPSHTHPHTQSHTYPHTHPHTHILTHTHIHILTHTHIHILTHTLTQVSSHTPLHTHPHTHSHTYPLTHILTHTSSHTLTYISSHTGSVLGGGAIQWPWVRSS